jgi:hypothetical protein
MLGTYEPDGNLSSYLELHVGNWETDFEEYWGLLAAEPPEGVEPADWELARLLDLVGRNLVGCAQMLTARPELAHVLRRSHPDEDPIGSLRDLSSYNVSRDRCEIQLAWEATSLLGAAKTRSMELLLFLSAFTLSPRAAAYLDRATQLYIWGFDPEVAVMCRAVLEAALEERIDESELLSLGQRRGKFGFQFYQYVEAAAQKGLISPENRKFADQIREAGNKAVHVSPGLEPEPFWLLASLTILLRDILPASQS